MYERGSTMDHKPSDSRSASTQPMIPRRILGALLSSVSAGVVPRSGAPYIAIGRHDEVNALLTDLESVSDGGGGMRFLIGRYGSGKSFLMQLIRGYALERDFITADADLSPERRLYGSNGSGVATYRELMKNLASKSAPDGGALPRILARWLSSLQDTLQKNGVSADDPTFCDQMSELVFGQLKQVEFLVGGFDFTKVVLSYYRAWQGDNNMENEQAKSACLRWLRGEYTTKTEAKQALGFHVSTIIDDDNWYDFLKLWAALVRLMGYRGLIVFIDECVNLYKIVNRVSRENNYEKILSMFNDTLQGRAPGLELILGGTPQFLEDSRRGLFSYEALRSRLCDSRFTLDGYKNMIGPVIRLRRLSDDELLALIVRLTHLHAQYYQWDVRLTAEEMQRFLQICLSRAGSDLMMTPREILRDYMTLLNILLQNETATFDSVVEQTMAQSENADDRITAQQTKTSADHAPSESKKENAANAFCPEDIVF